MTTRGEDGSLTVWMLGLCVAVLFLGGVSLDLWRAFEARRSLAGAVDAAAVAGASAIDEAVFRASGGVQLDPPRAVAAACELLTATATSTTGCDGIAATVEAVTVTASQEVQLTLLRVLLPDERPLRVEVSATVEPRLTVPAPVPAA